MSFDQRSTEVPFWHVLGLILAVLSVRVWFILGNMASMWIWGDEMLYYMTSYDLLHFGQPGVPHPNFMNYPPVTSLLVLPVHLLGISGNDGYHLSLIIMSLVQAAGVVAAYLTVYEVFGLKSRLLALLLLVGTPACLTFSLMSETPFIAIYLWILYFYVRQLKSGKARYALAIGLLIALAILTRRVGIGLIGSVFVAMLAEIPARGDARPLRDRLRPYYLTLAVSLGLAVLWKLIMKYGLELHYGYYGPSGYVKNGLLPALGHIESFLLLARKVLANLGYVSLSTYGICVPLLLWFCLLRHGEDDGLSDRQKLVRRLLLHASVFLLFASFSAAVHMFINGSRSPNTRYLMYGRYVEYFSPLLIALSFGILAGSLRWIRTSRRGLILATFVLGVSISAVIPLKFFSNLSGATSNMGIAWLVSLSEGSTPAALTLGPVIAVFFVLLLTSRRFAEKPALRSSLYVFALALALFNLTVCGRWIATKSQKFQEEYAGYSTFVTQNPELFAEGILIDRDSYMRQGGRRDRLAAQKLLVDHVDKAVVAGKVETRVGSLPVMSRLKLRGAEVLYQSPGLGNKIYGRLEKHEDD